MFAPARSDRPRRHPAPAAVPVRLALAFAALAALVLAAVPAAPAAAQGLGGPGAVFTATNDAEANAVVVFRRGAGGALSELGSVPTGGAGTGAGLGNQGAVTLDASGRHLFVVNAGSDTVSVFAVGGGGLELLDVEPSGGSLPISVTVDGDLVYVLNAGGDGNVAGLVLAADGTLSPLPGSRRPLSGAATDPAQVSFTPDGRFLVVTEKGTNTLVTYAVGGGGLPGDPVVTPSEGTTPFGFSFGKRSRLLVSEAAGGAEGASTVSSYEVLADGTLAPITSALPTTESAACWLVTTGNGRHAYVTNTASNTVTGLAVGRDGSLALLDADGVTAPAGAAPIDAAVSRNGRFLYVLNGADATIGAYRIRPDGGLSPLGTAGGLPAGVNGLAAL
jgi:6-phosphogluconolactonase (cycloisomerase 2 family)